MGKGGGGQAGPCRRPYIRHGAVRMHLKLRLKGVTPQPPTPPPEALQACFFLVLEIKMILGCVFVAFPPAMEGWGHFFRASRISTVGLSFLTFGHLNLNIPQVLEGCWNLICGVSACRRKLGSPNRPYGAHDASPCWLWGAAGRLKCAINPSSKCTLWAMFVVVNTSVSGACAV